LNALIGKNLSVDREWIVKLVPELQGRDLWRKDVAGNNLNTRGEVIDVVHPEALYAVTTGAEIRTVSLLVPPSALVNWDNYRFTAKVYIVDGAAQLRWKIAAGAGLYVRLSVADGNGIEVGSFSGAARTAAVGDPQWPNPVPLQLAADEWYLVECQSYGDAARDGRHFVAVVIDRQTVWRGWVDSDPPTVMGTIGLQVRGNSEVYFDDIVVEQVDGAGLFRRSLFVDTCDGAFADRWDTLDAGAANPPFLGLVPDESPQLDTSGVENVVVLLDYTHLVKAL